MIDTADLLHTILLDWYFHIVTLIREGILLKKILISVKNSSIRQSMSFDDHAGKNEDIAHMYH